MAVRLVHRVAARTTAVTLIDPRSKPGISLYNFDRTATIKVLSFPLVLLWDMLTHISFATQALANELMLANVTKSRRNDVFCSSFVKTCYRNETNFSEVLVKVVSLLYVMKSEGTVPVSEHKFALNTTNLWGDSRATVVCIKCHSRFLLRL